MSTLSTTPDLAGALSLATVRLARRLRGHRADPQISLSQLSALTTLGREGAMAAGALADREQVRHPSMTRTIASLTELNLIDRRPHPTDRRQTLLSVSPTGQALLAEESRASESWMTERLSELSGEEIAQLARAVEIIGRIAAR
ncbi:MULTISPECIES: MarR family winged helix-turn-helix transcriptional regulator [unclassified Nocardia]|uniref:MarR family winged helix-turn-helix transcriptional regulator n=1 Tax=unclassified Nocardia TaxID=2637762 RepID=UPI0033A00AC7